MQIQLETVIRGLSKSQAHRLEQWCEIQAHCSVLASVHTNSRGVSTLYVQPHWVTVDVQHVDAMNERETCKAFVDYFVPAMWNEVL